MKTKLIFTMLLISIFSIVIHENANAQNYNDKKKSIWDSRDQPLGMNDTTLERSAIKAMNIFAKNSGWRETFQYAHIISDDWKIIRNKSTGVITGRAIKVNLYATRPNGGKCTCQQFWLMQEYNGEGYQKSMKFEAMEIGTSVTLECIQ